jgi:hypothetical protein
VPWVLAASGAVALIGLLSAQLILLRAQLRHVSSQDRTTKVLLTRADPALAPLPATLQQLAPALRAVRGSQPVRSARLARTLALQAAPVLGSLAAVDLPAFFDQVRGLAGAALTGNRLANGLDGAVNFFSAVDQANLIRTLAHASALVPSALAGLPGALARLPRMSATLRASKRTQDRSLSVQRQSLEVQRQTLTLLQRSFVIQQELLQHARNLDSKIP